MRRIFIGTLVVLTIALINGCANRKITRVDPNETIDLSGRWNDSDSRLVSEEMIGDLLTSAWIPRYLKANDKRPVVVVGLVENKSHEHINSETFIKDVEKAIIRDGNIRLVVAGEKRNELRKERAEHKITRHRKPPKSGEKNWVPISSCKGQSTASLTRTRNKKS